METREQFLTRVKEIFQKYQQRIEEMESTCLSDITLELESIFMEENYPCEITETGDEGIRISRNENDIVIYPLKIYSLVVDSILDDISNEQ